MTTEIERLEARVDRGIAWFDQQDMLPALAHDINTTTLDMGKCKHCIGGQLNGEYVEFLDAHGLTNPKAARLGLYVAYGKHGRRTDNTYDKLTAIWRNRIDQMRQDRLA